MSGHEAFFLFKNCLTVPKWLHLLRSSPCFACSDLQLHDTLQREILSTLVNIHLTDVSWAQALLPVCWGVGVRSITDLDPQCFPSIFPPIVAPCFIYSIAHRKGLLQCDVGTRRASLGVSGRCHSARSKTAYNSASVG